MLYVFSEPHLIPRLPYEKESPVLIMTSYTEDRPGSRSAAVHIGGGYILTANHTFPAEGKKVDFTTENGTILDANLLWRSAEYDIALFKAGDDTIEKIADHYTLACETPLVGTPITMIGHPMHLDYIHTNGYIAGQHVTIEGFWKSVITVDGTIIPGMSGGPVLDSNSNLVGLIVGTVVFPMDFSRTFTGLSYVVPADVLCSMLAK
jgi:S1-C subfamily serine protease